MKATIWHNGKMITAEGTADEIADLAKKLDSMDSSTQAVATVTAASTPMASWHTCGIKLRVLRLPPLRAGAIRVILG